MCKTTLLLVQLLSNDQSCWFSLQTISFEFLEEDKDREVGRRRLSQVNTITSGFWALLNPEDACNPFSALYSNDMYVFHKIFAA